MRADQAVRLIDETAKAHVWGPSEGYWIAGRGWETKITYSEERAWELAVDVLAAGATVLA